MTYFSEIRIITEFIQFGFFMNYDIRRSMVNTPLYITGSSTPNAWALIELNDSGMKLCRGVRDDKMDHDIAGSLKITGVDLIEY